MMDRNGGGQKVDPALQVLMMTMLLVLLGLVMVASASLGISESQTKGATAFHYVIRHGIYIAMGLMAGIACFYTPTRYWEKFSGPLFLVAIALLVVVLTPLGKTVNGSQRWIMMGPISAQPSEIAKLFVLAYLASYLVRRQDEVRSKWSGFFKPIGVLLMVVALLLMEPDFGVVVVLMCAAMGMIFLSGVKLQHFLLIVVVSAAAAYLLVRLEPYRWDRFVAFMEPWQHKYGSGYQLTQSLIAFGEGELFGEGLGASKQKLFYLPEAHTDFVFAVLAEELGLLGNLIVIGAFMWLVTNILKIGHFAEEKGNTFAGYFCYGIAILFGVQALINIGVATGLLPTKGLTLPLVSYGGSSLIVSCAMVGVVVRIGAETNAQQEMPKPTKPVKKKIRKPFGQQGELAL